MGSFWIGPDGQAPSAWSGEKESACAPFRLPKGGARGPHAWAGPFAPSPARAAYVPGAVLMALSAVQHTLKGVHS